MENIMKKRMYLLSILACVLALALPTTLFAHDGEDHGGDFHIEVMHVMESGFHGKLDGKVVEVVLAPDATLEKNDKAISLDELKVGDSVVIKGTKMPGNKIGATKLVVDKSDTDDHSMHKGHEMGHEPMGH